jgi:hypothetical protein
MKVLKMNKKYKFLIVILLFSSSCSKRFDSQFALFIEEQCKDVNNRDCIISITDMVNFQWDKMYVFGNLTPPFEISNELGFDCKCKIVPDNYYRVVFLKNNKIVYQDQYYNKDSRIQWRPYKKHDEFIYYTPETGVFLPIKKEKQSGECFYDLFPIKAEGM